MTIRPPNIPTHRLADEVLLDYAAGGASEGEALVVVTHVAQCAICRDTFARQEAIAGALLDSIEPAQLPPDLLDRTLTAITTVGKSDYAVFSGGDPGDLPKVLADRIGGGLESASWQRLPGGFATSTLSCSGDSPRVRLLEMPAGRALTRHRHVGDEWMLVLQGSFADQWQYFAKGDFVSVPDGSVHSLVAGSEEDCICLILTRAPSRFTNPLVRLLAPILGL